MIRLHCNPRAVRGVPGDAELSIVSLAAARAAHTEMSAWPTFVPTPLRSLDPLARSSGVAAIFYKDESQRLGLGSFKALGGAYAAGIAIREWQAQHPGGDLAAVTLTCATDGNHGRSVAYGARRYGCRCVVHMHEHAPPDKVAAIQALGAIVVRIAGTYDDAVRFAREASMRPNWLLIADTSDDVTDPTPMRVMQGYGVLVLEILETLPSPPTHVFVQAGVGGLAAAVAGSFAEAYGDLRPTFVTVEPERAACVFESGVLGRPATVAGSLETQMAMLSCGEASPLAWKVLERFADAFITIDDDAAVAWTRRLSSGADGSPAIDVGISGAAGLAGLQSALADAAVKRALKLDEKSRVLVIGTEGGPNPATPPL
jgi:diaminopropionate ammonia-lyase